MSNRACIRKLLETDDFLRNRLGSSHKILGKFYEKMANLRPFQSLKLIWSSLCVYNLVVAVVNDRTESSESIYSEEDRSTALLKSVELQLGRFLIYHQRKLC